MSVLLSECGSARCQVEAGDYLVVFGTGIRRESKVTAILGSEALEVVWYGAHPDFPGLDQINLRIPHVPRERGVANLSVLEDGQAANNLTLQLD